MLPDLGDLPGWTVDGDHLRSPEGVAYAYVPGGWLLQGLSADEVLGACLARKTAPSAEWTRDIAAARPVRSVPVAPFLVSVYAHDTGRLPTEAELEWVLRNAGRASWVGTDSLLTTRNRTRLVGRLEAPFALEQLFDESQLSAEGSTRHPHTAWQDDDEEVLGLHAAIAGGSPVDAVRRDVRRLDRPAPAGPPPEVSGAALAAALSGTKAEQKAALRALDIVAHAPADDLLPALTALLSGLASQKPRDLAARLRLLGDVLVGPGATCLTDDPWRSARSELAAALSPLLSDACRWLQHSSAAVRAAATLPLSSCPAAVAPLTACLADRDRRVSGGALLALARLAPDTLPQQDGEGVAAFAEAVAGRGDSERLLDAVVGGCLDGLAWFDGDAATAVTASLQGLAGPERAAVAERLVDLCPHEPFTAGCQRHHRAVVQFAFPVPPEGGFFRPGALDPGQLRLMERYARPPLSRFASIAGAPASELGRAVVAGTAEGPLARPVAVDGGRLPLFSAIAESWTRSGGTPAHEERVRAWVGELSATALFDLSYLVWRTAYGDLWRPPVGARHPWLPYPDGPWPWTGHHLPLAIRGSAGRTALRERLAPTVSEALHGSRQGDVLELASWVACYDAGDPVPGALRDRFDPFRLAPFAQHGGHLRGLLDALGAGWVEERLCAWSRLHAEVFLAGETPVREQVPAHFSHRLYLLAEPSWSASTVAHLVIGNLLPPRAPGMYWGHRGLYGWFAEQPAFGPHLAAIPRSVHELFENGELRAEPSADVARAGIEALLRV